MGVYFVANKIHIKNNSFNWLVDKDILSPSRFSFARFILDDFLGSQGLDQKVNYLKGDNSNSNIIKILKGKAHAGVTIDYIYEKLPLNIKDDIPIIKVLGDNNIAMITPLSMPPETRKAIQNSSVKIVDLEWYPSDKIQSDKYAAKFKELLMDSIAEGKNLEQ
jgi:hypothetical protein